MELYSYQQTAVDKFSAVAVTYPNVLIGDDMGLGKTVTAIALDRSRRAEPDDSPLGNVTRKMTLVVTKKSIMPSWVSHFQVWAPELKVASLVDFGRSHVEHLAENNWVDVVIVNWEALRLMTSLRHIRWLHIIGDEVQAIKNRKAQVTIAYKAIRARFKTNMSGTWADNSPVDGWSILNHLYPDEWSSFWRYHNRHVLYREKLNHKTGKTYKEVVGVAEADALQEEMAPFYIRRLKEEVAPDLPEKVFNTVGVRLSPQQRRAYDAMRDDMLAWVGEHEDQPIAAPVVIAKLVRLQQFAIAYGKMDLVERTSWKEVPEARVAALQERGIKVRQVERVIEDCDVKIWEAFQKEMVRKLTLTDPSAKLDAIMEWLEEIPSNESAVVFGTSKMAANLLAARLKNVGESHGVLTGDVSSNTARRDLQDGFQAGKFRIFVGTIKAGGVGLTLTRASRMGFIDRDWSPSANRQAEDRIHRIGQRATCFYTDFVAEDTVDAGKNQRVELKWSWVKQILGGKS